MKKVLLAVLLLTSASAITLGNAHAASVMMPASGDGRHIPASQVPEAVMTSFTTMFPNAKNVQWEVEKEHGQKVYQAEFTQNGKRWKAQFATDGTFLGKKRA